jgi:hypothetical protein
MPRLLLLWLCLALTPSSAGADEACGDPKSGALGAVDAYMDTFNSGDPEAHAATLHYPSFRIDAAGDVVVLESAQEWEDQFRAARWKLPWHHTLYDSKEIVHFGPRKAHVAVHFTRYLENGDKVSEHDSLYVTTCQNGRWAIIARSSFVPVMRRTP